MNIDYNVEKENNFMIEENIFQTSMITSTDNHTLSDKLILSSNNLSYTEQLNRQMGDESLIIIN